MFKENDRVVFNGEKHGIITVVIGTEPFAMYSVMLDNGNVVTASVDELLLESVSGDIKIVSSDKKGDDTMVKAHSTHAEEKGGGIGMKVAEEHLVNDAVTTVKRTMQLGNVAVVLDVVPGTEPVTDLRGRTLNIGDVVVMPAKIVSFPDADHVEIQYPPFAAIGPGMPPAIPPDGISDIPPEPPQLVQATVVVEVTSVFRQ